MVASFRCFLRRQRTEAGRTCVKRVVTKVRRRLTRLRPVRIFLIARHGQSTLNVEQRVNGDPGVRVDLTEEGLENARGLGQQIANVPIDLCIHTRFERTRKTAELALDGRDVPYEVEPLLDDIDVGDLEGETIEDYRAWKAGHTRADAFPAEGGAEREPAATP